MWLLATDVTTPNWRVEPLGHSVSIPDQVLRVPLAGALGKKGPGKLEAHNRIEAKSHPLTLRHGHCWCSFAPWQAPPPTKWFSNPILLSSPPAQKAPFQTCQATASQHSVRRGKCYWSLNNFICRKSQKFHKQFQKMTSHLAINKSCFDNLCFINHNF